MNQDVRRHRLRNIIGGSAGNLVEWYDWYIYAAFALYFAPSFFPQGDQLLQQLNAAAIFGALHFYTQWFEFLGANPFSVLAGGILLIGFGLGLRWFNGRFNRAAAPAA